MKVLDQTITDTYALYNADCNDVMAAMPDGSIHLSIYSPPFAGLYHYTSSERDLSNSRDYDEFFEHYGFVVKGLHRITMPGRMTAVHCMDIPTGNTGRGDGMIDFSGDIIRLHERMGWAYVARYHVWKEPLTVRNRTMTKSLAHQTIVEDSSKCSVASADYLLVFRRSGSNPVPIAHPNGLTEYAGERPYASAFWDDVRLDRVLPYRPARDQEDERHIHPLQLDVIDRAVVLWSNPGERVFTPFMGVGSEVYGAVMNDRFGIGAELKPAYYRQAVKNLATAKDTARQDDLFTLAGIEIPA
jgi:DNA modification methylase